MLVNTTRNDNVPPAPPTPMHGGRYRMDDTPC